MKKFYDSPDMELVRFTDVIVTSVDEEIGGGGDANDPNSPGNGDFL